MRRAGMFTAGVAAWCITVSGCAAESSSSPADGAASKRATVPGVPTPALAADAYEWGLPLVISTRTMQTLASLVGVNRLFNQQQLSNPTTRIIVAPNVDTLYSVAVLDLRAGPLALTVPQPITDRYWAYQVLDPYTESFAYIGTRATNGAAGTWVFTPPEWTGPIPAGAQRIAAPTPQLFLLGRFAVAGPDDVAAATAAMQPITLEPVGTTGVVPPMPAPAGKPQAVGELGARFFDELGDALAVNPPTASADRDALARFASLGIGPGKQPAATGTADARALLEEGALVGQARIDATTESTANARNGWTTRRNLGRYGADFAMRAVVAQNAWGANVPEESMYSLSRADRDGKPYDGSKTYVMRFDTRDVPPAEAFWSITMYGADRFLVANSVNRYAFGDLAPSFVRNADGSFELYLSAEPPPGRERNWLPAPAGSFSLITRVYLPTAAALADGYTLPPVRQTP